MKIIDNNMYVVSGDSDAFRITLSKAPLSGDKIVFRVVDRIGDEKPLFELESSSWDSNHSTVLYINPEHTVSLQEREYPYELALEGNNGRRQTILWVKNPKNEIRRFCVLPRAVK